MPPPPPIPATERKPRGFDSGLRCLTAVFVFTVVVRVMLTFVTSTHSVPLIKLALAGVLVGQTALLLTYIVWSRRHASPCPPRRWAIIIAMIWVSLQLLAYFVIMVRSFSHEASGSRDGTKQEIAQTFQKYRTALLDADGGSAWALLDSHTTKFYSQALEDALSIPGADLKRLEFRPQVHRSPAPSRVPPS